MSHTALFSLSLTFSFLPPLIPPLIPPPPPSVTGAERVGGLPAAQHFDPFKDTKPEGALPAEGGRKEGEEM